MSGTPELFPPKGEEEGRRKDTLKGRERCWGVTKRGSTTARLPILKPKRPHSEERRRVKGDAHPLLHTINEGGSPCPPSHIYEGEPQPLLHTARTGNLNPSFTHLHSKGE